MDWGRPKPTYPEREPVAYRDYAVLREASGHAAESLLELITALRFYEPAGKVVAKATERLANLRTLGVTR
jgi:hypothetical protein